MKKTIWVRYILMAVSVLVIIFGWLLAKDEGAGVDLMLRWTYVVLGLAVGLILIMSLFSMAQNPKGALGGLLGLVVLLVIIGVSYALSSDTPIQTQTALYDNPFQLKISDTMLYSTYILLAGSVVAILLCELRNAFK